MPVEVSSISLTNEYLDVLLTGSSAGASGQYREIHDAIFAALDEHTCCKILIDTSSVDYHPNILLEHNTALDLVQRCTQSRIRLQLAVVTPPNSQHPNRHLEDTAYNRGVNLKVFATRQEALEWLL
ncbi:MAG TPA: STAS/SEC14 domain-containing protein [Abditibacteriaceae bacterium]